MVGKMKTDVDKLPLVFTIRKKISIDFVKLNFFLFAKLQLVCLVRFRVLFLPFPKFWKQNFMYSVHKHVKN